MIISEIHRHCIDSGNLTQKEMEEFFVNDENFSLRITTSPICPVGDVSNSEKMTYPINMKSVSIVT